MNPHEIVASSLLKDNGLREPLYVTALKYAGVKVDKEILPGHLYSLRTENIKEQVRNWFRSIDEKGNKRRKAHIKNREPLFFL